MPTPKQVMEKADHAAFEDAWLARYLARRLHLDTPAKRLAFAEAEMAAHDAARDRWEAAYYCENIVCASGWHWYTNARDWRARRLAWQRLIARLKREVVR